MVHTIPLLSLNDVCGCYACKYEQGVCKDRTETPTSNTGQAVRVFELGGTQRCCDCGRRTGGTRIGRGSQYVAVSLKTVLSIESGVCRLFEARSGECARDFGRGRRPCQDEGMANVSGRVLESSEFGYQRVATVLTQ